jgi:monoamine oxidase
MRIPRRPSLRLLAAAFASAGLATCGLRSPERPGARGSVLVVGAGLAGLAAARTLRAAGYSVVVLEARAYVGVRTRSVPFGEGVTADLGASWIHGITGNPIAALAGELGLGTLPTDLQSHDIFAAGGLVSEAEDAAIQTLAEELADAIEAEQAKRDEDIDLRAFFDSWVMPRSAEDKARARYLLATEIEHEYAADASRLFLLSFDAARAGRGSEVMLKGGYAQLAEAVAKELDVRLGVLVTRIEYGTGGVKVHTPDAVHEAKRCACAVPLGVFKSGSVSFVPPLPEAHRAAIERLEVGVLDKLFLRFAAPFWQETTSAQVLGRSDAPVGRFAEWLNLQALVGKPVLLGFNAGSIAHELSTDDATLVALALDDLRSMFGSAVPEPVAFLRTRWGEDPFARGSYSAFGVGSSPKDAETLRRALDGRLFFAGEHTNPTNPATTHGAWLSGLCAAADVVAS